MIAGSGTEGLLRVWDAATGDIVIDFGGLDGNVYSVTWSPDSTKIASGSEDGLVGVWNVNDSEYRTGQLIVELRGHHNRVLVVAWNHTGTRIASVSFGEDLRIWDAAAYLPTATFPVGDVFGLAWSPDGNRLAFANSYNGVFILDLNGTEPSVPVGRRIPMGSVAWNSDGSQLATGEFDDGNVYIWDMADPTGDPVVVFEGHTGEVSALAWRPDDRRLASAAIDDTVRVWDTITGKLLFTFRNDDVYVRSIAWSPDGSRLAFGRAGERIQIVQFPADGSSDPDEVVMTVIE